MGADSVSDRLRGFPSLKQSALPTPLQRLSRLSEEYGRPVYCKRDDLTGFGFGGNKSRKLDFLLADARKKGADTVVAVGANQSNFCRMAAAAAAAAGMQAHLVLRGRAPARATGNLVLDDLLGAVRYHLQTDDWDALELESKKLEVKLAAQGRKVYRLSLGGSMPVGVLGYVRAFAELLEDAEELGLEFDNIVHASSSAGTQAGLVVGKELSGWPGRIIGMSVDEPEAGLRKSVLALAKETGELLGGLPEIPEGSVVVDDRFAGEGYAARTPGAEEALELFARLEGIFLDRVYTAKAAAGLLDYLRKGRIREGENVLFLHTGGTPQLFE